MGNAPMFDPFDSWLGIPPEEQPPHYYRLLGINTFTSDEEAIRAAAEIRLAYMQTFAGGPHLREAKAISDLIAQARSVLLDGKRKSDYDQRLREYIAGQQASVDKSAAKPPVVLAVDQSPPANHQRLFHPRTIALCGVLSLMLVAAAGVLVYSGRQLQDPLARSESPKREAAAGVATEMLGNVTSPVASEPIGQPKPSLVPPIPSAQTIPSERDTRTRAAEQNTESGTRSPSGSDDTSDRQEAPGTIRQFMKKHNLDIKIALDERGGAATAFGVDQLPAGILIDKQGVVQRTHVGFDPDLAAVLTHELDSLVAGEALPHDPSVAARLHDGMTDAQLMKGDPPLWEDLSRPRHETPEFTLMLSSGRTIELSDTFGDVDETFEQSLKERLSQNSAAMLQVNYHDSGQTKLLISRRGKELHGPVFTFYDDGSPLAYASYRYGKRNSSLLTWDNKGRPFVFDQYRAGQRHGLRCLFKACADECKNWSPLVGTRVGQRRADNGPCRAAGWNHRSHQRPGRSDVSG